MAGTIPLSMTQQFDVYGKPLAGGQLYIIQVGTVSTPQNGFQDVGLTVPLPYPIPLDAAGRVPQFFVADGYVKIRLQDKNGVVQLASDSVMVIGASAGGGGGGTPVDPTQLVQTGNMIFRYGVGTFTGYVRLNGLSIGGAGSGATESGGLGAQANALFLHLYAADTSLILRDNSQAIVTRTTAANDWATAKNLALPDFRGYALTALDGMGNTPVSGRLTAAYFGAANADLLGAVGGDEKFTLLLAHLAQHDHSITLRDPQHSHGAPSYMVSTSLSPRVIADPSVNNSVGNPATFPSGATGITIGQNSPNFNDGLTTKTPVGVATPHRTIGPRKLVTFYMKL